MNSIEMIKRCMEYQLPHIPKGGVYLEWTNLGVRAIRTIDVPDTESDALVTTVHATTIVVPLIAIKSAYRE